MSIIGAGLAASVSAIGMAERAAVTKKAAEQRDEERLRKKLRDRFASDTADIEEVTAVVEILKEDESPADDFKEKKPVVHLEERSQNDKDRPSLDIQA